ncbi:DUF4880 domain-containing protein [Pseudomaricurvus alkylphenolicus]|uniref:FecR family protein n=1 Tax=Pseudomaricurvus alkylphenolicus TaxID=1306991 RepID=UPI001424A32E|nr:FecR domain-containing protein [Pseudomaricurvus alkylphenolicus]NIB43891.1 DUF4880 domain-containing protein [Pseudomaricurvus alkylphenolicus]
MKTPLPSETDKHTAIQWLVKLQSPDCDDATERDFYRWLESKPEHQVAYIEAEALWDRLEVVEKPRPTITPVARPWFFKPQAIAASFVVMMMLVAIQLLPLGDTGLHVTEIGEQRLVTLEDGSRVTLNTDSSIRVDLEDEYRLVHLQRGEVFFDVQSDASRPFLIETASGVVRVLGTSFSVRSDSKGATVTVVEGRVGITPLAQLAADPLSAAASDFESTQVLTADQRALLAADAVRERQDKVDAAAATTWLKGRQVYDGVSMNQVLADLNRYFAGEIALADPELGDIEVVAVLDLRNRASALATLESTFNLSAVDKGNGRTLLYRAE